MPQPAVMVLWFVIIFIVTLVHELGHALAAYLFLKSKNWQIIMGSGKSVIQTKRLVIKIWFFFGGVCRWERREGAKWRQIAVSAGGFTVNLVLAAAVYVFGVYYSVNHITDAMPWWWEIPNILFLANVMLALFSILPIKYPFGAVKGMSSDGLRILRLLRGKEDV